LGALGARIRIGSDERANRTSGAAPLGRREIGRHFAIERIDPRIRKRSEHAARDRDVTPHERFAIGQETAECAGDRFGAERAKRVTNSAVCRLPGVVSNASRRS
jgi:hypothetical protein